MPSPPVRFLARSAVHAALAANAVRPLGRHGLVRQLVSFGAGLVASEAPRHVLAAQATSTAWALRRLDVRDPAVVAGLALRAAAAAGLLLADRRGQATGALLDDALDDALDAPRAPRPRRPRPAGLVRTLRIRRRYVTTPSASYGGAGRRNEVDVWRRHDAPPDAPVLLWVHGGGWMFGDRTQQAYPILSHLAERGWVCVSASYRLSPRATWPDQIADVKRAIAWTRDHVADHGGDPSFVAIMGGSAGGHLASLAALTPGDPAFQPGFEGADTRVDALVSLYGVYDWTGSDDTYRVIQPFLEQKIVKRRLTEHPDVFRAASPTARVHPGAPPALVLHGDCDNLVPISDARVFGERLRATSTQPVVAVDLPGAFHAFDALDSPRSRAVARATERFLDHVRAGRSVAGRSDADRIPSGQAARG